jgi:hypothetical protein
MTKRKGLQMKELILERPGPMFLKTGSVQFVDKARKISIWLKYNYI